MEKKFIKESDILEKADKNYYIELMNNIDKVRKNLESDYNNIQFIKDRNLVDYYTYRIKAEEAQYDFLVQEAKNLEKK